MYSQHAVINKWDSCHLITNVNYIMLLSNLFDIGEVGQETNDVVGPNIHIGMVAKPSRVQVEVPLPHINK